MMTVEDLIAKMQQRLNAHSASQDTSTTEKVLSSEQDLTQWHQQDMQLFAEFVSLLRPQNIQDTDEIKQKIDDFAIHIIKIPNALFILKQFILRLFKDYKQSQLYADLGIFSLDGFFNQLGERIGQKILPKIADTHALDYLLEHIFPYKTDYQWLERIPTDYWTKIFDLFQANHEEHFKYTQDELLNALTILSYRISGLGLLPEFLHALPELSNHLSPFLVQNKEIIDYIEHYHKFQQQDVITVLPKPDASQALVMLNQCLEMVQKARRTTKRIGVSFSLTYSLAVLEQCLNRCLVLLNILDSDRQKRYAALAQFIINLSHLHHEEKSVRTLLKTNSELIALQVTENASRTGEHYVSTDRQGLFDMYKRAAGGGLVIAFMATLKTLTGRLVLAPFMQAFLYSMNYGLGFVFIHIMHFTVATKQPAATAAALASTIQQRKGSKTAQLAELTTMIINIIRTQFWAILGNISIAIPVAGLIALCWEVIFFEPLMSHAKATKSLHDLNPFTSLAIPHAAIAGVCLFLSGLIGGYFDNVSKYRQVKERILANPRLARWIGEKRLPNFAHYISNNLGAIMGNFLFGCMLGSIGTIGMILGLPLDIRHIAFASANFIQGLMNINGSPDIGLIFVSFLGVLLIGLTNLFVSFTLTIIVALRSRQVQFEQWKPLAKLVLTHFFTRPSDFFWVAKSTNQNEANDTNKNTEQK